MPWILGIPCYENQIAPPTMRLLHKTHMRLLGEARVEGERVFNKDVSTGRSENGERLKGMVGCTGERDAGCSVVRIRHGFVRRCYRGHPG